VHRTDRKDLTMTTSHDVRTSPLEVVRRFHDAEAQFLTSDGSQMPSFEGILHPDFVLYEPASGPYGGQWRGEQGLARFLRTMHADWSDQGPTSPPRLLVDSDTVVVLATLTATFRATQQVVVFPVCQVVHVRDGLVLDSSVYYWDPTEVNDILGGKSPDDR
jgi:ketosteroid isomerase-like protein